ncbi:MAG: hypothetical protein KBT12_02730 [Bacteroidales bacterium]|nr:hypothetical protein [Candidatus Physcousia equi]
MSLSEAVLSSMYILRNCPCAEDILDSPELAAQYILNRFCEEDLEEEIDDTPVYYT